MGPLLDNVKNDDFSTSSLLENLFGFFLLTKRELLLIYIQNIYIYKPLETLQFDSSFPFHVSDWNKFKHFVLNSRFSCFLGLEE
ncbi:hypothetical protein L6452_26251 [Arctium lappa]|uniref:Uncharacterized protein n=1 Tax=Arctium lappa TaxID=4217 RepID=A0ACB9ABK6_ARCLA|nr:hypothetical protein L6452_26251 [Arctium lappa]